MKYLYRLFQWIFKGIPISKVPANISINDSNSILKGKRIVITGGNRGIGYHIAKRLLADGAEVIIVGRDLQTLQDAAKSLGCSYLQFNINNISKMSEFFVLAEQTLNGKINCLINNAGICNIDNGFLNVTKESFDEQFLTNVKSPFFLTQAFIQYVLDNKIPSSSILFITSERGLYPDDAPYGMTKAAIGNIIPGIAHKFAQSGIQVNAIAPGVVANVKDNPEKYDDLYLKGATGKRYILPEEIANIASFLMSDNAKCISGEIIPCDQANYLK